jgi:hypothetical protein
VRTRRTRNETGDLGHNRAKTQRLWGQTMLVVLRIAAVLSDIGVFLNDPGPWLAGSIEKDAFTSLLCPKRGLAARADASPLPGIGSEKRYIGPAPPDCYAFLGGGQTLSA